ncbi:hypothetical protein CgunFtcFv8_011913 [Champsocephalus gunnari]|uniref:Uncharacterized protein n=1 Tax=Champsocephalus gunnari TaxID=52237 RepID=A0AAN8D701_CHAGU|nr:hypothetical protein CgunFtcFv8_011913 [Champsocephalus gunnari]
MVSLQQLQHLQHRSRAFSMITAPSEEGCKIFLNTSDKTREMRCHVMAFTVCWQKCHFQKAYLAYPVSAGRR